MNLEAIRMKIWELPFDRVPWMRQPILNPALLPMDTG